MAEFNCDAVSISIIRNMLNPRFIGIHKLVANVVFCQHHKMNEICNDQFVSECLYLSPTKLDKLSRL